MAKVDVKNIKGEKVGSIELDDAVFGARINEHLLWEAVKWQRAKKRAGTHFTRTVSEVRGTGKKPWRQKGTGRARQGSLRAHQHVGGGVWGGPKPRDYEYSLNKKSKKGALRSALSLRLKEQQLIVVDAFEVKDAKTRAVVGALEALGAENALIVDSRDNQGLQRGSRNLTWAKWIAPEGLNVYDILHHETLVMTSESVKALTESLKPRARAVKEAS